MDFESSGLMGIWELADDATRRSELEAAWTTHAEAFGITLQAAGSVRSNFADDDEGWTYYDHTMQPQIPTHLVHGGYFGGYIMGQEHPDINWLAFSAPSKFLGDKTMYAGGTLEYYLWYCCGGNIASPGGSVWYLVTLLSENGNLYYRPTNSDGVIDDLHYPTDDMPTVYEIDLTAGVQPGPSGAWAEYQWYRWDGAPADESEIWMSLASIQAIHIQAGAVAGTGIRGKPRAARGVRGFPSVDALPPSQRRGAIVMTNSSNGEWVKGHVLRAIAVEYDWPDLPVTGVVQLE
jgi:hypothetical protein